MTQLDRPLSHAAPDPLTRHEPDDAHDHGRGVASQRSWLKGPFINVGSTERAASVAGGALLALFGLSRRSLPGVVLAALGGSLAYRGISGHCHTYSALGIDTSDSDAAATPRDYFEHGIHLEKAFTINKSPWELYSFWRDFRNLPKIMSHLERVDVLDDKRSHWVAKAPALAGGKVEWDAEIINDEPNALIAWRSLDGADVDNAGSVRFVPAPGDRGTEVKVVIDYIPPAGRVGSWLAYMFGEEPSIQIQEDLRKFKRVMETGEVATTQGQPRGNCSGGGEEHRGW